MSDEPLRPGYKRTEVGVIPQDWEVRTLGAISTRFLNGGTPSTKVPEFWNGDIPWITGADVINQKIQEIRRHITKNAVHNSATNVISQGNLLVATRTGVGKLAIASFDVAISQDLTGVYVDECQAITEFVFRYLDYSSDNLKKHNQGTSIAGITRETLAAVKIPLPPLPEQRAIAEALADVDALLAALDRLIAKKRAIKQAAMQDLLTGRVRLPGFVRQPGYKKTEVGLIPEDWSIKAIGNLFDFLSTSSCSRGDLSENGEIFYIHYGDIHTKWNYRLDFDLEFVPRIAAEKIKSATLLADGDLVLVDASEDEPGAGKGIEIVNLKGRSAVPGLHTIALRGKTDELADGFKAYIQSIQVVKSQIRRLVTGLKVFGISKTSLASVLVPFPSAPEQRAIAAVLSDMDAEIAALERRRAKTQALKQGMMQELLTGRVRLVESKS